MKHLLIILSFFIISCGDDVTIEPPAPEPKACDPAVLGLFKASCILKDATTQYVLVNEHPDIPDVLLELPGDAVGFDETPESAAIRGVKDKTGLEVETICFVFNTSVTNVFNCGTVPGVGVSKIPGFLVEHHPDLDNVNWK